MSVKSILKFISAVGLVVFFILLLPPLVGFFYDEDVFIYTLVMFALFIVNLSTFLILKSSEMHLGIKESIISVNLIWILLGIGGAIPLVLYSKIDPAGAFFEAISGFTTTGASVYRDVEILPKSILFHRSLTHWIGGIGIIVLGVGLLPLINPSGSLSLFKAESTGISIDKITPKIKDTANRIWAVYILFTLVNFILLMLFGMNWFDAINHAFATISTGGFSTKNSSLGGFSDGVIWTTTFFMTISGINFLAHIRFFNGDKYAFNTEENRWYLGLIIALSFIMAWQHVTISKDSFYYSLMHSFFTVSTLATTTGFASLDYEKWGQFTMMIALLAMIMSANAGSTAGGIKMIRFVLFFKNIALEIKRTIQPDVITSLFIDGKQIRSSIINSVFGFFALFIITVFLVMMYLYARGFDFLTAFATAISMVGNIGPGLNLTGPSQNYAFFSWYDKIILSFAMIIGRLECYTVFIMLSRSFWKKF
ncbi:TrkH family potassium uptake protein [Sulfurospirillum deleyianum]|uniref:Cation transporter n=1 Tax=Sulfurospirillum deleyianum (strain ATCC 51133 / DSM 6946 / 5175) TaxID=525898 RepID=D1B054_SULD5|nr:TrkH family potassium uptake protein [Sulfurospirillum deleyianum]ACZ11671.1 cation transporter [Sulfurospirillum deleyianum DSM 6946]